MLYIHSFELNNIKLNIRVVYMHSVIMGGIVIAPPNIAAVVEAVVEEDESGTRHTIMLPAAEDPAKEHYARVLFLTLCLFAGDHQTLDFQVRNLKKLAAELIDSSTVTDE